MKTKMMKRKLMMRRVEKSSTEGKDHSSHTPFLLMKPKLKRRKKMRSMVEKSLRKDKDHTPF
jgi:hypothetical protein